MIAANTPFLFTINPIAMPNGRETFLEFLK